MLPWSPFFNKFLDDYKNWNIKKELQKDVNEILDFLLNYWFRNREMQIKAQELYINQYSKISYERITNEVKKINKLLQQRWLIWYTVDSSPTAIALNHNI